MEAVKDALVKLGWSHYDSDLWWKDGVIKPFYDAVAEELEERVNQRTISGICPTCSGEKGAYIDGHWTDCISCC